MQWPRTARHPAVDGRQHVKLPAPQFALLAFVAASVARVEEDAAVACDDITEIRIAVCLRVLVKKFVRRRDGAKVYSVRLDRLAVVQTNEPRARDGEFWPAVHAIIPGRQSGPGASGGNTGQAARSI